MNQTIECPLPFVQSNPEAWELIYNPETNVVRFDYALPGDKNVCHSAYWKVEKFIQILKDAA